jgi:hypothetical protein
VILTTLPIQWATISFLFRTISAKPPTTFAC